MLMPNILQYISSFIVGGIICAIAQVLIDKTKMTPARILVLFVLLGEALGLLGLYKPLVDFAGAGATVPITGFGYTLAKGVMKGIDQYGLMGIFSGGMAAASAGIAASVVFAFIMAVIFKPKAK